MKWEAKMKRERQHRRQILAVRRTSRERLRDLRREIGKFE